MPPQPPTSDDRLVSSLVRQLLGNEPQQIEDFLRFERGVPPRRTLQGSDEVADLLGTLKSSRGRQDLLQPARLSGQGIALKGVGGLERSRVREIALMRGERRAVTEGDRLLLELTNFPKGRKAATDVLVQDLQLISQEKARRTNLLRRISKVLKTGKFARGGLAGIALLVLLTIAAQRIGGGGETA